MLQKIECAKLCRIVISKYIYEPIEEYPQIMNILGDALYFRSSPQKKNAYMFIFNFIFILFHFQFCSSAMFTYLLSRESASS